VIKIVATVLALAAGITGSAQASVIALFTQRADDVLLEVSGSLNLGGLGPPNTAGNYVTSTLANFGGMRVGPGVEQYQIIYVVGDYFIPFVAPGFPGIGTYISGLSIAFDDNGWDDQIRIQGDYVSNSYFESVGVFDGDFASMGITDTADVVMRLPGEQTLTVRFAFQADPSNVPLPASLPLLGAGLFAVALARQRRRR